MANVPIYRRDFKTLADLRAEEARVLLAKGKHQGAYYLAGYAVECALKACIAKKTKRFEFPAKPDYVRKLYTHGLNELLNLAGLDKQLERDMLTNKAFKDNWITVKDWTEESRYATSRLPAKDMYNAVTGCRWSFAVDKSALVADDLEVEALVVAALSASQIPVAAVEWNWVPELDEWQLVVVTSLHDTKGPREAYARITDALSVAKAYRNVPIRKLFVKSPEDPFAKELVRQLKLTTEGTIHIVRNAQGTRQPRYSVVFAPYVGSGGAIPSVRLEDDQELRSFLEKRLGIGSYEVNRALHQLGEKGNASIFNVELNLRRARKLKLAA